MTRLHRSIPNRAASRETPVDRTALLRRAIQLSAVSVFWGGIAGALAFVLAIATGSLSLFGFGVDAVIDSMASIALIWRFRDEGRNPARAIRVEHLAERIVGVVLLTAALALGVGAIRSIVAHSEVGASPMALGLLVASIAVLPPLAVAKRRVAARLWSGALRADAYLTGAAAFLAREGWTSVRLSEGAEVAL